MSKNKPAILITVDSMKNPNTGLFYFGKSLGLALLKLEKQENADLHFYLPKRGDNVFEKRSNTLRHSEIHKYYFPKRKKFDLVHFTDQICRLKPSRVSAKKVLTIHDLNALYEKETLSESDKKNLDRLGRYIEQCDRIVAISEFVAKDVTEYFPQAKGKIEVVYNGADKLIPKENHTPAYTPERPFIFSIGEMMSKKNFHVLPALLLQNDFELIISGNKHPDGYVELVESKIKEFGVETRVKLTGPISDEDKAWYYKNCLAFAFPSVAEGFGLPIIEAMHFGKPVFLSTRTAVPEIGGDVAFYFNDFEPENMRRVFREGLQTYHDNPDLSNRLKQRAESFTWDRTAREYFRIYNELLG